MTKKEKWLSWSNRIGVFFVFLFIIDVLWHYLRPVQPELINQFYEISYLWFTGFNLQSLVLALVQTYVWAYVIVGIWYITEDLCKCKK